jgi:hypothetical protein
MKDLEIEPTKNTPLVNFFSSGQLTMAGLANAENAREFFDPLILWISNLDTKEVDFDIIIEYINTSSAKKLLELLQKLQSNKLIETIRVNWLYQNWDEDMLDMGKILEESLKRIKFEFVEHKGKTK